MLTHWSYVFLALTHGYLHLIRALWGVCSENFGENNTGRIGLCNTAYMRRHLRTSLVQIMVCHLFCAKPLSEPMLEHCQLDPWEQIAMKSSLKFKHFHSKNAFENVICKLVAILSRPECVNSYYFRHNITCTTYMYDSCGSIHFLWHLFHIFTTPYSYFSDITWKHTTTIHNQTTTEPKPTASQLNKNPNCRNNIDITTLLNIQFDLKDCEFRATWPDTMTAWNSSETSEISFRERSYAQHKYYGFSLFLLFYF